MTEELATLNHKLDRLTAALEAQEAHLQTMEHRQNGNELVQLHAKLDLLLIQMEGQQRRQEELDELKRDLIPIANHMVKLSIDELAEIGTDFQAEDLLFLVKRLLRDTHLLVDMLDRLESTVDLVDESKRIGKQVFNQTVLTLDHMERAGYFRFAQGGLHILERIVTEFGEEDIQALGDNIVTIMKTVRNLTQPEIMSLTNNALDAIRSDSQEYEATSTLGLIRELSDPKVRKGLARLLNLVKTLADPPVSKN